MTLDPLDLQQEERRQQKQLEDLIRQMRALEATERRLEREEYSVELLKERAAAGESLQPHEVRRLQVCNGCSYLLAVTNPRRYTTY